MCSSANRCWDMDVSPCVENDMQEVKEDATKKEEDLYPAMSTVTLPLSPV